MQETQVPSLGAEAPLAKEMVAQCGILAWKNPWTEEPGWTTAHGVAKSWTQLSTHTHSESRKSGQETGAKLIITLKHFSDFRESFLHDACMKQSMELGVKAWDDHDGDKQKICLITPSM